MVYETRVGDVITLGASSWRIDEIGPDRVLVTPAPGEPGKLPFWHGDAVGRPIELGRALGDVRPRARGRPRGAATEAGRSALRAARREAATSTISPRRTSSPTSRTSARRRAPCRPTSGSSWSGSATSSATGGSASSRRSGHACTRRGRWRSRRRLGERLGAEVQTIWTDDGIAVRLPEGDLDGDRIDCSSPTPKRSRTSSSRRSPTRRCSRRASARTPRGRCSCRVAGRGRGPRSGSSGSARPTCSRWHRATAPSRSSSRRTASACPTCSTCRRCATSWAASRTPRDRDPLGRDRARVALRIVAALRLRRGVHVRGRRADCRTPRAGPHAGPRPAARAAGPGGAARAARSGGAGRPRAVAPGPDRGPARDDRATRSTTCCAGSATCRPTSSRRACRGRRRRRRRVGARSRAGTSRRARRDRGRVALDRDRGCGPLPRRGRRAAAGGCPGGIPGAGRRTRSRGCSRGGHAPMARSSRRTRPSAGDCRSASSRMPSSACSPTARWCVASSGRAAPSASGAIPRSCASCGGARWRGCGARSNRSIRRRWHGSCRRGRASRRSGRTLPPLRGSAALERLAEVVDQLAGRADPGVGPRARRPAGPRAGLSAPPARRARRDGRGRRGWAGAPLGRDDGRIVLFRPGRDVLRGVRGGRCRGDAASRRRARDTRRSAPGSPAAVQASTARSSRAAGGGSDRDVLDALWDLVWAGEVTNDTFTPLRALRWRRPARDRAARPVATDVASARRRRPVAGRWSTGRVGRR